MGDKDTPLLSGKDIAIFIDGKEAPVVKDSVKLSAEPAEYTGPIPTDKLSFSVNAEGNGVKELCKEAKSLLRAQEMLDAIREELALFYHQKPPRNRKERRERGREIKRHIERFKRYCRENHIELKNKP